MPRSRGAATVTRKKAGRRKKECPDGADCKYQHEHQHTEEYDHPPRGAAPKPKPTQWGSGRKLGGGGNVGRQVPGQSEGRGAGTTSAGRQFGGAKAGKVGGGRQAGASVRGLGSSRIPATSRLFELQAQPLMRTPPDHRPLPRRAETENVNAGLSEAEAVAQAVQLSLEMSGSPESPITIE
eukprot:m.462080 g.462080  ORF g.462080 m.462080 type:complete len:181 (-) comp22508_c0_seq1:137-679(-)